MILSEHNFCSIVPTVEKGRTIYSGIQKFVALIMSVNVAEIGLGCRFQGWRCPEACS